MAGAYEDNYWNDQGQGGVANSGGDAYAESGYTNEPDWAKEDNQQVEVVQQTPKKEKKKKDKKSKKRKTTEDEEQLTKVSNVVVLD
eukprot:CAMPEP_0201570230 /NCGR_PEP_ID=MMETSP0190_2-20130828/12384_1 /ASSEMBLY_ACC=CAM_ASM_000263 /TAXON_ID=37353 /ORGANISM="Rosalina sp." /LENGTH=85 /DNA_ID=CAMNT_0047993541 /DNA_START=97 /DNA_END=355 /DNA_ORIENTATION=+